MLKYNTQQKKLVLPEYGRNIQNMVDHCMAIEDREERNACAAAIINTMETLFPAQGDPEEYHHKLWDQLAIMSDFKLDIDWPFEVIKPDDLATAPDPVDYAPFDIKQRQYGKNMEAMVQVASQMPEGEERDALALLLANHMKKLQLAVNPDGVDDAHIFKDLRNMSRGVLNFDPEEYKLHEFKAAPAPSKKKKKK